MHIFVTGTQRSGSTFTASMLALAPGTGPLFEPLNPLHPDRDRPLFRYYFQYLGPENEEPFLPLLQTLGKGALRLVIKEPTGVFAAEWMADRLGMTPVITIRHPAAFVASCRRLGWSYGVDELLDQPLLLQRYLGSLEAELRAARDADDQVLHLALLWKAVYGVVDELRTRRPEWCFLRHEDASRRPLEEFRRLYDRLGLEMTPEAEAGIREHTTRPGDYAPPEFDDIRRHSAAHVRDWERLLDPADVARIRRITAPVADRFYGPQDW